VRAPVTPKSDTCRRPTAPLFATATASLFAIGAAACAGQAPPIANGSGRAGAVSTITPARALCTLDTGQAVDPLRRERSYPTGYWMALLLRGYRDPGEVARPARDCQDTLARLEWDGCPSDPQPGKLPERLLNPDDLVVTRLDDRRRLVWAMTDHLSDGEAEGPVAIAELENHGINVLAIGILRAYSQNVSLRLERLGSSSVLVADAEYCEPAHTKESCQRAIRLVPLIGDRFTPRPLLDAGGACIGRPFIPVRGAGTAADGRHTRYRIENLITFADDSILFREQLAIDEEHHRGDPASASYVTRVQADRQVSLRDGNLVATGPSLLSRWLTRQEWDRQRPPRP